MATINISGLDKAEVLSALYNASKPQGMGFLHYDPVPMSAEEARQLLEEGVSFDYLKGRVLKIDLSEDEVHAGDYDRDNGEGAARRAISSLRGTKDSNNILIRAQHASATSAAAQDVLTHLSDTTHTTEHGDLIEFHLGLDDVADILGPKVKEARASLRSPLQ